MPATSGTVNGIPWDHSTLERLAEAARQERHLGLPVLVSGGRPDEADDSLAGIMSAALQNDFGVPVRWREDRSRNTFENAAFSAEILRRAGVPSAILVTHGLDMARALWSFRAVGYPVIPAAPRHQTISQPQTDGEAPWVLLGSYFPQVPALLVSYNALHELIGLGWYLYRYGDREVGRRGTIGFLIRGIALPGSDRRAGGDQRLAF